MEWKNLSKEKAMEEYKNIVENAQISEELNSDYSKFKNELEIAFSKSISLCKNQDGTGIDKYKFDCYFGIELYKILSRDEYFMREHDASNDNIWRYIQLYVIPNIIKIRVGYNEDAFYKKSNRLYLKRIWWYIHLSMYNNSLEETKKIILDSCNNTDTILQLVDRSGKHGYRVDLYRTIMLYKTKNKVSGKIFRNVLMLNNARVKVINPFLVENGIDGYVNKLYGDVL